MRGPLRLVILKPSKYLRNGYVERFRKGFMPNSTLPHLRSLTPAWLDGTPIEVHTIDEYVYTDLKYFSLLQSGSRGKTLVALVGVQSHQFHRALDLAAYALQNDCLASISTVVQMTPFRSSPPARILDRRDLRVLCFHLRLVNISTDSSRLMILYI